MAPTEMVYGTLVYALGLSIFVYKDIAYRIMLSSISQETQMETGLILYPTLWLG